MKRIPLRLVLAVIFAALSVTLLTWGLVAPQRVTRQQVILPKQMQLPNGAAVPETRLLTLHYPATIRLGEADRLRLNIAVQPDSILGGNFNTYETYQIFVETRLEMSGMNIQPTGTVSEPLRQGQSANFFWSVHPREAGRFEGTVWLYLRFVPRGGGAEIRQPISAQTIQIEVSTLFGLQAEPARLLSLPGAFISTILGFSYLMDALRWLLKRKRKEII